MNNFNFSFKVEFQNIPEYLWGCFYSITSGGIAAAEKWVPSQLEDTILAQNHWFRRDQNLIIIP